MAKLGFIGFGEAAFNIAKGLGDEGLKGIIAYDKFWNVAPQSDLICKRAEEANVELAPSLQAMIDRSEIILSAVSADMAVSLAQTAKPFLKKDQIYVDINATSPMTKEEVDAIISPVAQFVDCAVMGPVPNYGHKVPVSVSGNGAKIFIEKMAPYRMNITLMDAPAGSASASKMFRSIFMKGFVMLLLEMLVAAHKYQVEDDVLKSVKKTLTAGDLLEIINGLVARGVIHSERREHEMDEVIATLNALGVDGTMSVATQAKLRWCTNLKLKDYFSGVPPQDFHEIFAAMKK
jgi:3-hydroxyisobutyrate dehydrogenase-like beta-hydroxyacid dehydrogenase